ncbi:MAG: Thioredoxin [Syntrophorhabdus sp. PtaU1.Bin153]|nr:MAG: Thioredoxin [Syntrophorhabdus sp. PtaU1.Bin153]
MSRQMRKMFPASGFLIVLLTLFLVLSFVPQGGIAQTVNVAKGSGRVPRLVDVGTDRCTACKMMAPILEELKKEYAGVLDVELVDVGKNPSAGQKYGIWFIPTQIFYDGNGKELKRHRGFISKQGILERFQELGIPLKPSANKGT